MFQLGELGDKIAEKILILLLYQILCGCVIVFLLKVKNPKAHTTISILQDTTQGQKHTS